MTLLGLTNNGTFFVNFPLYYILRTISEFPYRKQLHLFIFNYKVF